MKICRRGILCLICLMLFAILPVSAQPQPPVTDATSYLLMEAQSGTVLSAKNEHEVRSMASITKLMTCLIAAENAKLQETVKFSQDAVFSIESGSPNIGIDTEF